MNGIVKYKWHDTEISLSKSDVKNHIATSPNVTDKEVDDFMDLCKYRGLNPYLKEAYLIKYGTSPAKQVVSKDVMDARVEADIRYDGEEITHNYKRGMDLNDFWVRGKIYRKGCSRPVADVTVYYPEYVGKKKDGTVNSMWTNKPFTMLQKCCKAQMKRESNPRDLAGMYLAEEFDQEVKPTEEEIKNLNPIPQANNNHQETTVEEPSQNGVLATQPQKDKIYGTVICEKCGTRVYGFKCLKCKNADNIHITTKGFIHSHLLTREDLHNEMEPAMHPDELTKIDAMIIWDWWLGDAKKFIIGERKKREEAEKEAKPEATKEDRISQARGIVEAPGKVELREGSTGLLEEEEEPGSSPTNAIKFKGKRKVSKAEDFVNESDYIAPEDLPE